MLSDTNLFEEAVVVPCFEDAVPARPDKSILPFRHLKTSGRCDSLEVRELLSVESASLDARLLSTHAHEPARADLNDGRQVLAYRLGVINGCDSVSVDGYAALFN